MKFLLATTSALLLASPAFAADVCITVPSAAVSLIQEAATDYNATHGTSLTTVQWAKLKVREAVVAEIASKKQFDDNALLGQMSDALKAAADQSEQNVGSERARADEGWE